MKIIENKQNLSIYINLEDGSLKERIKKLMWWKPYHVKRLCYLCKNPLKGQISWGIDIKDDNFTRHYFVCGLCNKIINK